MDIRIDAINTVTRSVTFTILPSGATRTIEGIGASSKAELIEYLRGVIKEEKASTFMTDVAVNDVLDLTPATTPTTPQEVKVVSSDVSPVVVRQKVV
jgi:hypothetical protein